ncbi:MAG: RNA pseudouridine synthase [Saprospiraceae bacterium]|nr:RNA pseudouridine synthase [Saprospiraceae bacterium]
MICYESPALLALNKPPGLAVQAKDASDLFSILQRQHSEIRLLNRIDQPASGLVLFARNSFSAARLSQQLRQGRFEKTYLAVVGQQPKQDEGLLIHYLLKQKGTNRSVVTKKQVHQAKEARLSYKVIGQSDHYHLLEIKLLTGRHHQIRVQLAALGMPIKGDVKYGFRRSNRDRSIHLHAFAVQLTDPATGKNVKVVADPPDEILWNHFKIGI